MTSRMKKYLLHLALTLSLCGASVPALAGSAPQVTVAGALTAPLAAPGRIALDDAGTVYVADVRNQGVLVFERGGRFLHRIAVPGVVRGVAWNGGRLLVSHDRQVTMYGSDGRELGSLSGFRFQLPSGIAGDSAGNIYVTDSKANQVASFTPDGQLRYAFGVSGSGAGALNFPTGIAFEKLSGELAVADTMNNRVQFFDSAGRFRRAIGTPAAPPGPLSFTYPQGLAFDYASGTRLYVVDTFQGAVKVIDLSGSPRYLSTIGSYGSALGELMQPADVAFDPRLRRLLVADGAGRVTFFGIDAEGGAEAGVSGALLDPVPSTVSGRTLLLSGNVNPGARVSVSVGGGAAGEGGVTGTRWSATATLSPGGNLVRVSAQWSGGSAAVTVAVLCSAAQESGGSTPAEGGSVDTGSTSSGGSQGSAPATWSYPGGGDCHHTKGGGLVCRDR